MKRNKCNNNPNRTQVNNITNLKMITQIYLRSVSNLRRKKKSISNFILIYLKFSLVIDTVKELQKDRKCWRLVGGVLIEKTVGEVVPAL